MSSVPPPAQVRFWNVGSQNALRLIEIAKEEDARGPHIEMVRVPDLQPNIQAVKPLNSAFPVCFFCESSINNLI
jgi:hypothetical protein